jgi:putative polyhydroxyalkanoic acid system protein
MSDLKVEYPLGKLTQDEAKARLQALGEYLTKKHGINVIWSGDQASVRGKYMVVHIEGSLLFRGQNAVFEGKDPGFLWRGKAKDYLHRKLGQYLDPTITLEDLPRG